MKQDSDNNKEHGLLENDAESRPHRKRLNRKSSLIYFISHLNTISCNSLCSRVRFSISIDSSSKYFFHF